MAPKPRSGAFLSTLMLETEFPTLLRNIAHRVADSRISFRAVLKSRLCLRHSDVSGRVTRTLHLGRPPLGLYSWPPASRTPYPTTGHQTGMPRPIQSASGRRVPELLYEMGYRLQNGARPDTVSRNGSPKRDAASGTGVGRPPYPITSRGTGMPCPVVGRRLMRHAGSEISRTTDAPSRWIFHNSATVRPPRQPLADRRMQFVCDAAP